VLCKVRTVTPQAASCFTLRLDGSLRYQPGQSIAVLFPGDPKKRYYSLSSSPTEPGHFEITLKCEVAHPLTPIIQSLKRGDTLEIEGPFGGGLTLPEELTNPLCLISAGTGVTPLRSIVKYLIDQTTASRDVWLLHSVKRQSDLLFREDFSLWAGAHPWFHYVPTITQDIDENWINETGRINETLIKKHIPEKTVTYMLCGPSEFVKDLEAMLSRQLQVPADQIRKEKW